MSESSGQPWEQDDLSAGVRVRLVTSALGKIGVFSGVSSWAIWLGFAVFAVVMAIVSQEAEALLLVPIPLALAAWAGLFTLGLRRFMRNAGVQFTHDSLRYWDGRGTLHEVAWACVDRLIEQGRKYLAVDYRSENGRERLTLRFLSLWDTGAFPNRREPHWFNTYAAKGGLPDRIIAEIRTRAGLTEKKKAAVISESWIRGLWVPGRWARIIYSKPNANRGTGTDELHV